MSSKLRLFLTCLVASSFTLSTPWVASADENEGVTQTESGTVAQAGDEADLKDTKAKKSPQTGIEEITVTARKREESLQATPVAITAFSQEDLKDQDIRRIQEITSSVPNLQFDSAIGTGNSARIYLRGVGNGDPIGSDDPGVGVYVDGVYLPRAQGALLTVSDVERVEVLRGPQGTLFGKNTIGGAISITSRKPDLTEFGGNAEVRLGNYNRFDTRLSVNVPLVPERAAARFSFATASRDPVAKNKGTGSDLQDDKLLAGRAQFLFVPSDTLELSLSADHSIENRKPSAGKCVVENRGTLPASALTNADNPARTSLFNTLAILGTPLQAQQALLAGANVAPGNNGRFDNPYFRACASDAARDDRSFVSDLTNFKDNLKTFGTNGTITWDISESLTLKSISAWQHRVTKNRADVDYTGFNFVQSSSDRGKGQQDSYSQEFQFVGDAMDEKFNYVFGVYGFREDNQDRAGAGVATQDFLSITGFSPNIRIRTNPSNMASATMAFADFIATATPAQREAGGFTAPGATAPFFAQNVGGLTSQPATPGNIFGATAVKGAVTQTILNVDNKSYAAYSQGTYDLTEKLAFTAGLRFTHERKRIEYRIDSVTAGLIGANVRRAGETDFQFERSTRFTDFSPMANLSFQASDDMLLYANYSKGFKSGGFNGRANAVALTNEIDDEKVTAYEIGMKSSWLDNRLTLNVAGYYNIYQDIQLTIPSAGAAQAQILVLNAGKAEIKGGEIEAVALPFANLQLSTSLGVTNARYVEFDDPNAPRAKDRDLLAIPNYTANFAAAYMIPMGSVGDLRLRAEWSHRGKSGTDVVETKTLRKGKNGELDATIGLALADGVTEIVLFGNNLLDREYFVNGVSLGASVGNTYRFFNDPRTYGIEVRRKF